MATIALTINGKKHTLNTDPQMPLLWAIRDVVGLKGTKFGCGMAQCGSCTVHINGVATRSCVTPVSTVANKKITTIEGIGTEASLHAVQQAWIEEQVPQCGYCQSGQIMSAVALLKTTAAANRTNPTDAEIDAAMQGNLCRCGTYDRIRKAIHRAADLSKATAATTGN